MLPFFATDAARAATVSRYINCWLNFVKNRLYSELYCLKIFPHYSLNDALHAWGREFAHQGLCIQHHKVFCK